MCVCGGGGGGETEVFRRCPISSTASSSSTTRPIAASMPTEAAAVSPSAPTQSSAPMAQARSGSIATSRKHTAQTCRPPPAPQLCRGVLDGARGREYKRAGVRTRAAPLDCVDAGRPIGSGQRWSGPRAIVATQHSWHSSLSTSCAVREGRHRRVSIENRGGVVTAGGRTSRSGGSGGAGGRTS